MELGILGLAVGFIIGYNLRKRENRGLIVVVKSEDQTPVVIPRDFARWVSNTHRRNVDLN